MDENTKLETHADRQAAGLPEPAAYESHQEPPQNPEGGLPVALRGRPGRRARTAKKKPAAKKPGRRSSSTRKK